MNDDLKHDLAIVAGLVGRPTTVDELAAVLDLPAPEVLVAAQLAVSEELISAEGHGYVAPAPETSPKVAYLAGRFADLVGERGGSRAEVGRLLAAAGRWVDALEPLVEAAGEGDTEALTQALTIHGQHGGLAPADEGRLRVSMAAHLRTLGRSAEAFEQATMAARRLEGPPLVDALGFAAALADDRQQPQVSEALTALAAGTAASINEPAKEGSLLTLLARALSRIGYPEEADAALDKGKGLLEEHGSPTQRRTARNNEAWILLDRGEVRRAASLFDTLLAADDGTNDIGQAVAQIYLARSLFGSGTSNRALELSREALAVCETAGGAPLMLAHMALAEGALAMGRGSDAVASAEAALGVVEADLPQWRNRIHLLRAQSLLAAGDRAGAAEAVAAGTELTPDGANGWRIRRQLDAVGLMAAPVDEAWPIKEAEELTDELLQARWYSAAIDLMVERARREGDRELGLEAAALARRLGNPLSAAAAIEAVNGWDRPEAIPIARDIKDTRDKVAAEWLDDWKALPAVATALALPTAVDVDEALLDERIDDALRTAGLTGVDVVLSPAQRRAKGLVRRRVRQRRGMPWWGWVAAAIGVVAVSYGMAQLVSPESTTVVQTVVTTAPQTTTTTIPLERTVVAVDDVGGVFAAQGNVGRTGEGEGGFRELAGVAWRDVKPGGLFRSSAVALGIRAFISSSTNDAVYSVELATGRVTTEIETDGRVLASPAVGKMEGTRGDVSRTLLIAVSEAGTVYAKEPGAPLVLWQVELDEPVVAPPLVTNTIAVVGSTDGRVFGLVAGAVEWVYPAEGEEPLGAISNAPMFDGELIYVVAGDEMVILRTDGSAVCDGSVSAGGTSIGSPMSSDGEVLIQTDAGTVRVDAGRCPPGLLDQGTFGDQAPAVSGGVVYSVGGSTIFAFEPGSLTGSVVNEAGDATVGFWQTPFDAGSAITAQPSIAEGVLYVGTQDGLVFAVDAATGEQIWAFDAGAKIEGSPVPLNGLVLVLTADGEVIAITGS